MLAAAALALVSLSSASALPVVGLGTPRLHLDVLAAMAAAPLEVGDAAAAALGAAPLEQAALPAALPLELAPAAPAATPSIVVPPRYGFVLDDGRAFWFAAGASSVTALGTHVVVGLPTLLVGLGISTGISQTSPPALVPFVVGLAGGYVVVESALAALAATLVFNNVSKIYDGNYLVVLAAHVAGSLLGTAVSGLTFGVGVMLLGGLNGLVEFTGSAGLGAIGVFSILGALPAIVIGGIALVGVPALIGAWALSVSASTKDGYAINPAWKEPLPETAALGPRFAMPAGALPVLSLPLP